MKGNDMKLISKAKTNIETSYQLEIDVPPGLGPSDAVYYPYLIDVLRWMVYIDQVNICLEISMMPFHLALTREGHLEKLYNMFA